MDFDPRDFDSRDEARLPDRDGEPLDRATDSREPFMRDLDLPRGHEREIVRDRDREYTLRGSETRTLAAIGAFRVVSSRDLRDQHDRPLDPRSGDLRHLREQGLVEIARVPGSREHAVALTKEGRALLEGHRDRDQSGRQTFWDGLKREREREHDLQVYRAYQWAAERLAERGARIDRIKLDHELSVSIRAGFTNAIATVRATTDIPIGPTRRSELGPMNTTSRTSMTRSTSLT